MRCLGIDYGKKRIGIAISDPGGRIAFPAKIISNRGMARAGKEVSSFAKKEGAEKIILGLPVGLDGKETKESEEVRRFASELKKNVSLPIEFENEMFTSRIAEKSRLKKKPVDASAAAIILQSYLDKQH